MVFVQRDLVVLLLRKLDNSNDLGLASQLSVLHPPEDLNVSMVKIITKMIL